MMSTDVDARASGKIRGGVKQMANHPNRTPGYRDPRYYAGMYLFNKNAWEAELRYAENAIAVTPNGYGPEYRAQFPDTLPTVMKSLRDQIKTIKRGRVMAEEPGFSASFDDARYGSSWRSLAKR